MFHFAYDLTEQYSVHRIEISVFLFYSVFGSRSKYIVWILLNVWTYLLWFTGQLNGNWMYSIHIARTIWLYFCSKSLFWKLGLVVLIICISTTFIFWHSNSHAAFLVLGINFKDGIFINMFYDKKNKSPFFIARMPHPSSNIPSSIFWGSFYFKLLRIVRYTLLSFYFTPKVSGLYQ